MSVTASWAGSQPGNPGRRVQIAIVSPDIVARIRHAFASKGLTVQIDRLPCLEFTVGPGPGAAPAAAALGDALVRLVGSLPQSRPTASAHYQLSLLGFREGESTAVGDSAAAAGPEGGAPAPHQAPPRAYPEAHSGSGVVAAVEKQSGCSLSPREVEVMSYVSQGMLNADIAARLGLSPKTVKNHVNHIFAKLGAHSRVEAVLIWQSAGRDAAGIGPLDSAA